ncbi:MAG: protein kinase [Planctomycetota bacterium]
MEELIGTTIGGCRIDALIGKGGMGAVYRGTQMSLKRPVAIKIMASSLQEKHQYIERFLREAQIVARLNHPNIIHIYDTGQKDGTYYIIMEFVEGRSLTALIKEQGALKPAAALDIAAQIVQGLAAAWQAQIVHRDIKPENIILTPGNRVKIADFGLAKGTGEVDGITMTGQVMGTPAFMSPEQCRGEATDFRTDIYAFGITLYYMLTGKVPYTGSSTAEIIFKHINAAIPSLVQELGDPALKNVDVILRTCLCKDTSNRCGDYGVLLRNIETVRRGGSPAGSANPTLVVEAPAPSAPPAPAPDESGRLAPAGGHTCSQCGRAFDQEPDFHNEVTCPDCKFRFRPGAGGTAAPETGLHVREMMRSPSRVIKVAAGQAAEETLEGRIRRVILLQPRAALELMLAIVAAVKARGTPYRLILPEQILIRGDGGVSVNDTDAAFDTLAPEPAAFASPELARGEAAAPASDVYSLGLVLFYMLTGRYPVESPHLEAVRQFHLGGHADLKPGKLNPIVSATLTRIIRMMCGAGTETRLDSLATVTEILQNELKRAGGATVDDLVSAAPAETAPATPPPQPAVAAAPPPSAGMRGPTHVACSQCREWNPPAEYVCKGCGKLLVEENPDRAPKTAKEYLEVGMLLHSKARHDTAMMVLREGQGRYFTDAAIGEQIRKVEAAQQEKNLRIIEDRAAESAGRRDFTTAIIDWEKAAAMSGEARTRNYEKIRWAKSELRRRRPAVAGLIAAAVVVLVLVLAFLFPQVVLPPVNRLLGRMHIRIAMLERWEPKGLDAAETHPEILSHDELAGHLTRVQGRHLSAADQEHVARMQDLLVTRLKEKLQTTPFWQYGEYIDQALPLVRAEHHDRLRILRVKALNRHLDACLAGAGADRTAALAELDRLVPLAAGTMVEEKLTAAVRDLQALQKREQNPDAIKAGQALLAAAWEREQAGDLAGALDRFKQVRTDCADADLFPGMEGEARTAIDRIGGYQSQAAALLGRAAALARGGRPAEAAAEYGRLIASFPLADATRRAQIPLEVSSDPAGAGVFVNGARKGVTPLSLFISPREESTISVKLDGFLEQAVPVTRVPFAPGTPWKLAVTLLRAPLYVLPAGAPVSGIHICGAKIVAAAADAVVTVDFPEGKPRTRRFPYPGERPAAPAAVQVFPAPDGFGCYLVQDRTVLHFDPLTDKLAVVATLPLAPAPPLRIDPFFPSKDIALVGWDGKFKLVCFDLAAKSIRWQRAYKDSGFVTPHAAFRELVVAADPAGPGLQCLDRDTGKLVYAIPFAATEYFLVVDNGELIVAGRDGQLMRFNMIKSRSVIWKTAITGGTISAAPLVSGGTVVTLQENGICRAFQRLDGTQLWEKQAGSGRLDGGLFLKNSIYIYDLSGTITVLDQNGVLQQRLFGKPLATGIYGMEAAVVFADREGNLVLYSR